LQLFHAWCASPGQSQSQSQSQSQLQMHDERPLLTTPCPPLVSPTQTPDCPEQPLAYPLVSWESYSRPRIGGGRGGWGSRTTTATMKTIMLRSCPRLHHYSIQEGILALVLIPRYCDCRFHQQSQLQNCVQPWDSPPTALPPGSRASLPVFRMMRVECCQYCHHARANCRCHGRHRRHLHQYFVPLPMTLPPSSRFHLQWASG